MGCVRPSNILWYMTYRSSCKVREALVRWDLVHARAVSDDRIGLMLLHAVCLRPTSQASLPSHHLLTAFKLSAQYQCITVLPLSSLLSLSLSKTLLQTRPRMRATKSEGLLRICQQSSPRSFHSLHWPKKSENSAGRLIRREMVRLRLATRRKKPSRI